MARRKIMMILSTAWDLPKHREEVEGLRTRRFRAAGNNGRSHSGKQNAVEVSLRMFEEADIYLGILAYRLM